MPKILIVEDEKDLRDSVRVVLESQNYLVDEAGDGTSALDLLCVGDYDVIILDWNLPDLNGTDVCRKYRSSGGKGAVIMLTGKRTVDDKETGLDAGADDYLTKPVHHRELLAQIRAALRRNSASYSDVLKSAGLLLDPGKHTVSRDNKEIDLLPKEFALLEFFMRHPNTVFSPEALMERVWPTDSETSPDMIRKYVSKLREKIDKDGEASLIRTVHGIGYRFEHKD